jgi:GNAT superfamily N-acetyltransferase
MTRAGITIDYLANHRELAEQLAQWSWSEWQWIYEQRGKSFADGLKNYRDRMNMDCLPLTLVALDVSEQLIGTVSLKLQDLEVRPEIENWLGGMFVDSRWRRRGVATLLMERVLEEAKKLSLPELHLWAVAPEAEALYLKLGWEIVERAEYGGRAIVVMQRDVD